MTSTLGQHGAPRPHLQILDSLREYAARLLADPRSALARIAQQGGISSEDVLGNITDVLSEADRRLKGEDVSDDAPVDEVTSQEDADAFVEAAARGDLSALRGLVRRNLRGAAKVYDPNMADSGGRIALLEALRGGHHDVVEWLLSQKTTALPVDVNVVEAGGQHRSSLMLAFDQDGFDVGGGMVRLLLSHGADPSAADASGRTLAAVVRGNLTQEYFVELATDLAAAGASAEAPGLVPLYFSCVGVNAAKATLAWKIHELQLAGSSPRSKPLVLALVGPAAHGRATLAVAAAQALGVGEDSTFRISLAVARTSTDLLGVVGGRPSSFAMFLTRHTRRRFVLLLDNFDSFAVPDMAVWRYLFARGSLVVEGNVLDLSRGVIFVKTSWGESAVANYSMGPATVSELIRGLSLGGAAALQGAFGPFARSAMQRAMPAEARPVADEDSIDVIVPFIEFNANEAMVIVDQYLRSQVCEPLARPREMPVRVDDTERADAKNRVVGDVLVHTHSSVRELVFDAWASGKRCVVRCGCAGRNDPCARLWFHPHALCLLSLRLMTNRCCRAHALRLGPPFVVLCSVTACGAS